MESQYRICNRCVMDTSAEDIYFDENGICNFCTDYINRCSNIIFKDPNVRKDELQKLVSKIKKMSNNKPYDCIMGVSGGVDSSFALVNAVNLGLRPLAVHMDNGWNSELAQNNIENIVNKLNIDLYTYVINWEEYRNLMNAFFLADVVDIELLYDNAMIAVNYRQAAKYGLKYILAGTNMATEGMRMPINWNWFKFDASNIKAIGRKYAGIKLNSFPSIGVLSYAWYQLVKRVRWVSFLDYLNYNKNEATNLLKENYNYKPYSYKHYESIFTRFYQGYILKEKFNVDKRRVHLSTLILSNQFDREEALNILKSDPYSGIDELEKDKQYFLKKMGWSDYKLDQYLNRPIHQHNDFPSELWLWRIATKVYRKYNSII